ncbi:MAG: radical SAM/SPASM domain-containing protein [bacterium]
MAQVELTRNCNHRCVFCFQGCKPSVMYKDLKAAQWKSIIEKLVNLGVRRINFSGGENFLHNDFIPLVKYARNEGFEIVVNTNGSFSCEGIADHVDEVIFSVHGLGKTHDEIVGTRNSFSLVEQNILRVASRVRVSINMVLVALNYEQINQVFDYFSARCRVHKFSPTLSVRSRFGSHYDRWALAITRELLDDYRERLTRIPDDQLELKHGFRSIYYGDPEIYTSSAIPLVNCAGGKYKLVVEYDGSVYPCNFFRGDEYYCGNILTDDECQDPIFSDTLSETFSCEYSFLKAAGDMVSAE